MQGMRKTISAYPAIKGVMSNSVTKEQALIRIQRALMNEVTFPIVRLGILDKVPIEGRKLAVFLFQEFRRKSFVLIERLHKQGKSLMKFLGGQSLLVVCVSSRVLIQSEHAFRSRYPIVSNVFFPSSWARKRKLTVNFQNRGRRKPIQILENIGVVAAPRLVEMDITVAITIRSRGAASFNPRVVFVDGHVKHVSLKIRDEAVMYHLFRATFLLV